MPAPASDPTRVYLTVPYAEKDEAKRHGARWDPERKRWWIERQKIATNPGIHRWMSDDPALAGQAREAEAFVAGTAPKRRPDAAPAPAPRVHRVDAATRFTLPACDCPGAPWDTCEHTPAAR